MYDPHELLQLISANTVPIVLLCGLALIANFVWYFELIRLSRRDKVLAIPPAICLVYLAHDGSYLLKYDEWFNVYDHWFCKFFWAGIVITFTGEVIMFAQTLKYGRSDILPMAKQSTYIALMFAGLLATVAGWALTKNALTDDLYLMTFMLMIFWAAPFDTAMLIKRGSRKGQSVLSNVSLALITPPYWICGILYFGPEFQKWPWIAIGIAGTVWPLVNAYLLLRTPVDSSATRSSMQPLMTQS